MLFRATPRFLSFTRILLVPFFYSSLTLAQTDKNFQYLLFEPSLLNEQPALPESGVPDPLNTSAPTAQVFEAAVPLEEFLNTAGSPPADQLDRINFDIANYKKVILDLELKGGAYEASLSEELLALASLYQKSGDYLEAQKILNRAAHITRVNNGLFDASQVPLLKKVIENYVELGDLLAADRQQEALFYMQKKIYGEASPELLPGLKYFAEWNLFAATTTITPPPPTEDSETGEDPIVDMAAFKFEHLIKAQNLYDEMAQILIRNPGIDETHLLDAENKLLVISHLFATRYNSYMSSYDITFSAFSSPSEGSFVRRNDLSYRSGTDILENRVTRLQEQPVPDLNKLAQAKIALADWLLMFSRRMTALDLLEETYEDMASASVSENELNRLFNPPVPQEIPTFLSSGYSRADLGIPENAPLQYKGFIDIEFKVNRFGVPSSMTILETSPDTDKEITDRLINHIRYSQYRPRLQAGTVKNDDLFQLRYHYTY